MQIIIAADHAGFRLKEALLQEIQQAGHEVLDLGAFTEDSVDYPDYAQAAAEALLSGKGERAVLVCGSAVGVSVAANKFPGIRAAVCHDTYSAHQGVEHDDMNVLCLGQRIIGIELAREILHSFLAARFLNRDRYLRRLQKIEAIELRTMKKGWQ